MSLDCAVEFVVHCVALRLTAHHALAFMGKELMRGLRNVLQLLFGHLGFILYSL